MRDECSSIVQYSRSPAEAFLFLRIFCFAALVPLLLRLRLPTVERILRLRRQYAQVDPARTRMIVSMTDAAIRSGKPFVRRGCLVRGTTLYYFLSRAGLDVSLDFGIGQVDETFAGHCWLVMDGQPYLEKQDPRSTFAVVYSIPACGSVVTTSGGGYRVAR